MSMSILMNYYRSKYVKQYSLLFPKQIFTNYYVTQPSRKRTTQMMMHNTYSRMRKSGIIWGKLLGITDVPYICYTSRIDHQINLADFIGRIRFGNCIHLDSGINSPFPKGAVHLTIVKTAPDRIGMITVGDNVTLNGTSIVSYQSVTIGNNVLFGPQVFIMDCDGHPMEQRDDIGDDLERLVIRPVEIMDNAWIGAGSVILKGVTIGKNSIVGINSVVTESVPDNMVVAGNPARIVKELARN